MRTKVGSLSVELVRAEAARFRRPLLFVHGLWTDAAIWTPIAGYLSHRGWESWAPSLRDAARPFADYGQVVAALRSVLAALPGPPIIVTHDIGVVAGLKLALLLPAPALVAVAPVLAPADGGHVGPLGLPRFARARLGARTVEPPAGALRRRLLGRAAGAPLRADSGEVFRALIGDRLRLPSVAAMPGLVIGGEHDLLVPPSTVAALSTRQGWERRTLPERGHLLMLEPGWEHVADYIHRWIVRAMGEQILALLKDEDDL